MAKLSVTLPSEYGLSYIMESKDFDILCGVMNRARPYTYSYHKGEYYHVLKPVVTTRATTELPIKMLTEAEFDNIKNTEAEN